MKKYLFIATAFAALASCSTNDYVGDQALADANNGQAAITFNNNLPSITRAGGADAATDLGNQFIVYGEKSETADGAAPVSDGSSTHQLVFKNYAVEYTASTAYNTTSNTKNWEYVGLTQSYGDNVTPKAGETQTIKYWDYSATNYVFTAFSAKKEDLTNGKVKVTKTTAKTTDDKVYGKGYSVTIASGADLSKLYFSDRNVIASSAGTDRTATNTYGGNATMTFRNALSHIRVGMYETISGYSISSISFKITGDNVAKDASSNDAFGAICPNVKASAFTGTIDVTYYTGSDGGTENHPKLVITPTAGNNNDLILGTGINAVSKLTPMKTSSAAPTWDTPNSSDNTKGDYTAVLPQITNSTNLKLKATYVLYNASTGETITVTDATAEIPAKYLQWKPNYKYTYIFKISENTNGSTGQSVTGLYPITFDAIETVADDGTAEYITTVSEPSITTFGVKDGKYVASGSEYAAGSDIYATIISGGSVIEPTLGTNVNILKAITSSDATNFPVTEASVAEAVAETGASAEKITYTVDNTIAEKVSVVPGEDGNNITQNAVHLKSASMTAGTYAVAYRVSAGSATACTAAYDASATYYSTTADAMGFYPKATPTSEETAAWDSNKSKYCLAPTQPVYVYKVIVVQ